MPWPKRQMATVIQARPGRLTCLGLCQGLIRHSREPPSYRLVLLLRDSRLADEDEVALPYGPLMPVVERHLQAVAERSGDALHPRAREDRAVDRDGLPAGEPLSQRGHDR